MKFALIDVHVLPWRLKFRVMGSDRFRDGLLNIDPLDVDDLPGLVLGLGLMLLLFIAAPLVVVLLAVLLFSVELPIVVAFASLWLLARFGGLVPWTVVVTDPATGSEERIRYRNLLRARAAVRSVNSNGRVPVRWSWM